MGRKIGENKSQMALHDKKGRECSEGKYLVERLEPGGVVASRGRRMGRGDSGGEVYRSVEPNGTWDFWRRGNG